ncbi:MAG: hypothetical protein RLZZ244_1931 [Verrucomicrobiota bacterium]
MRAQLNSLRIRNLALVEDLTWSLEPGFTAVTGETGSGKSMIVGALKLLVGERADKSLIRSGADACTVEAVFELQDPSPWNARLLELGVEPCEDNQLLIKRLLTASGSNRQFVNGSPTTLSTLKVLGDSLVDLHGPHDHQSLLAPELQRSLLDAFGCATTPLAAYHTLYAQRQTLLGELDSLHGDDPAFERECALLEHQVSEIESAELREEEEPELLARYHRASQGRRVADLVAQIQQRLADSEPSVLACVAEIARPLRELERIDPEAAPLAESHARAVNELEDLSRQLQRYSDSVDLDPESLQRLESRVNLLENLKRKYGPSLAEVLAFGSQSAQRLRKLQSRSVERQRIQEQIRALETQMAEAGGTLSRLRSEAAPRLATQVTAHMHELGLAKAAFSITLAPLPAPSPHGLENVEYWFSPNPGEPPKPLRAIASSGETSRIMLAVKSALAQQDSVALLVFDEIDANVGGEIAHSVGQKMAALGAQRQVVCISHLPQVASKADHHFVVSKTYVHERTLSDLAPVQGPAREAEIARMLGGKSDSALALAKSLLAR